MTSAVESESSCDKCFVCWRDCPRLEAPGNRQKALLPKQLSVLFLLRKVLHVDSEILEDILFREGNPEEWRIKLCGCCHATVREAEFIYKRVLALQTDLEGLTSQIKTILLESQEGQLTAVKTRKKDGDGEEKWTKLKVRLRENFLENWRDGRESSHVNVLYATPRSGSVLDGIQTSLPIQVNVASPPLGVVNKPVFEPTPAPVQNQLEPSSEPLPPTTYSIKREPADLQNDIVDGDIHDWEGDEPEASSPPECEADETNSLQDDNWEPPLSPPPRKDRRFTRKKPNLPENRRKQKAWQLLKVSLEKVPENGGPVPDLTITKESSEKSYSCPNQPCQRKFSKKYDCYVHVFKDHYGDPMPHHCHICDARRFQNEQFFRRHMTRYHARARHPFDDDFIPDQHSAEALKSLVQETADPCLELPENSDDDEEELPPDRVPDEILAQFHPSKTQLFTCRIGTCGYKFNNEMLRDGHEKRKHLGVKTPFACQQCPRKFARRTRLLQHLAISHFSSTFSCPHCGARFGDKISLSGHIGRAHLGESHPFKCSHCPQRFARLVRLNIHAFKKHGVPLPSNPPRRKIPAKDIPLPSMDPPLDPPKAPPLQHCWICHTAGVPLKFDSSEDLKSHNASLHPPSPDDPSHNPYYCPAPLCSKSYRTPSKLDAHIVSIHKSDIVSEPSHPYSCPECSLSFHAAYLLDAHMAKLHQKSNYMCHLCAKPFRNVRYLEDHQRQRHYKELAMEPLKCPTCGKILNTKKSLAHHIKLVHLNESAFKCSEPGCSFGAMYESSMKVHMNIKHSSRKNAICPVCSKTFAEQFYLSQHMLRMHSSHEFTCTTCSRKFKDPSTYKRHLESHQGHVHKCPLEGCGKEYNTRHAFRVHLKQHQARGQHVEIPPPRYASQPEVATEGEGQSEKHEEMEEEEEVQHEDSEAQPENQMIPPKLDENME